MRAFSLKIMKMHAFSSNLHKCTHFQENVHILCKLDENMCIFWKMHENARIFKRPLAARIIFWFLLLTQTDGKYLVIYKDINSLALQNISTTDKILISEHILESGSILLQFSFSSIFSSSPNCHTLNFLTVKCNPTNKK